MMRRRRWVMMVTAALVICQVASAAPAAELAGAKSGAPRTDEEGLGGKMFRKAVRGGQNLAFGPVADVPRTGYSANDYEPVVLPAYPFEPGPTEVFPDAP